MSFGAVRWGILGAGFLLGSIGVKAVCSKPAKDMYVKVLSKGMQIKASGEAIIEEAKSNLDDIVAEASYMTEQEAATAVKAEVVEVEDEAADVAAAKA